MTDDIRLTDDSPAEAGLFRERDEGEARVTSAELFFDLVFVFAVTQVSHFLLHHLDWIGALEAAFLLLAVWSAWVDTVLVTNLLDPARQPVRIGLLALMIVGLIFSSALPEAFNHGGLVFALAFVAFQLGRTLFMVWASRARPDAMRHFQRMAVWTAIYGLFWIAGGLIEGPLRFVLWAIALGLDYGIPIIRYAVPGLGRTEFTVLHVEGAHIAERVSLFIMIALGESVLVTGATFAELTWTPEVMIALGSGLLQSMAMWWIYFYWSSDLAKEVIARAPDPGRFIYRAFGYVPWIVVAGIVTSAVGDDLALAEPGEVDMVAAAVVLGGPALFLLGVLLFEFGAFGKWSRIRLAGLAAIALLAFAVPYASTLILSLLTTLVLVAVAIAEHVWILPRARRKLAVFESNRAGRA